MAKERKSVRMQEQIKTMSSQGMSIRKIAQSLNISRQTVRKVLGIGAEALPIRMTESPPINWTHVREEVGKGCTIKQIHRETAPEISYLNFWRTFRDEVPVSPEVTIRLHHKPGERTHRMALGSRTEERGRSRRRSFLLGRCRFLPTPSGSLLPIKNCRRSSVSRKECFLFSVV